MHSEKHPQVTDRSGSIDNFDIKPTVIEGNRNTNPFETNPEVTGDNERALPSSFSSSSSSSSLEDLFQVDTGFGNFESHAPPSKYEEINVSNNNSKSKAFDKFPGSTSTSQLPQVTDELIVHDMPTTQSPPRQVMSRSGEYDPLRIPSAIFERSKSLAPQEWSVASNESLFSIPIGNNSFSRDQFKSGELTKTDELIVFNPSPTIPELGADGEVTEFEKGDATRAAVKNAPKKTTVDRIREKAPTANVLRNPSDMSSHSNLSSRSFAFPIKKKKNKKKKRCCACGCMPFFCCRNKCKRKKSEWPSCYCSNCSCTFCYFRWPSCYSSKCSWAFCYCLNCSLKGCCCHSSTTLTDRVKSVTVKPDVAEKQRKKPLAPEATPKSSSICCCFSCFSCHPCSCSFSFYRCFCCLRCRDCGCCCCRR